MIFHSDDDLLGGESIYCINRSQIETASDLAYRNPETAPRIQDTLDNLETRFSRNERAAIAFLLIERLRKTADEPA
ncbi:MAG: hypothetical protein BWK77_08765 [Verrucomicrobia bacterium A1]|nr:MAG: hypothetical protein BWK77_08765 [Verrucomicrobia bacterium A1]